MTKWHFCSVYLWLHVFCQLCLPFHPYCLDCSIPCRSGYPRILGLPTLRCLDHHLLPPKNVRVYISFTYPNVIIKHVLINKRWNEGLKAFSPLRWYYLFPFLYCYKTCIRSNNPKLFAKLNDKWLPLLFNDLKNINIFTDLILFNILILYWLI